ncbi:Glucose/arabinose dehydrogenase, beta-propeller fold [Modicisalibacter ilicicola DSM 19980]|uniref:Glucose/arabinose dehydrogenase, beta-propeller fold n=1 Tax=Modicisalibacter ilicicola DSM 19980 TaxID=1121942 RepID=A0A1M4X440_9GAMM|nr:PQQ-dependent sugar dehydrogenase [Halomonas ilicicola]SHE88221.1 Glucose/arabinose dehydrogenase, beta-propeller fold [Halomonas ilicicola DSM 19980]
MKSRILPAGFAVGVMLFPLAHAQTDDTLEKLGNFQTTGETEFTVIDQDSPSADAIRKTLERIKLPRGFTIDLYALVPDARHMAVGPQGVVIFVGTRKTEVWAVTDRDKNRVADEVKNFAPSLAKSIPNGPCFSPAGVLYIAEQNRVLAYPAAEFFYESPDVVAEPVIPGGELIPEEFVSYNHTARVCDVGPDGKLYISLGQPYNVAPKEHLEVFSEYGIGGIIRVNQDGSEREVYTRGVRNSVGHDFHPGTGNLWFTDNQVDGMGDDIPPGEINRQTEMGQHFGHPWFGGGEVRTNEYKGEEVPVEVVHPVAETVAHAADLGMVFYTGKMFPEKYRGGIFNAQHGSWNRTEPVGARVMFTPVDAEGNVTGETVPFAEGWLDENGEYLGRPVDVAQLRDGSLLVSDDLAGAVYRIAYTGSSAQ